MSNGFLSSSKNALVFAGGVLLASAMIAGSFGGEEDPAEAGLAIGEIQNAQAPAQPAPQPTEPASSHSSESDAPAVTFDDWIDDDSLVDDTTGFSTDPGDQVSVIKREDSDDSRETQSDDEEDGEDFGDAELVE